MDRSQTRKDRQKPVAVTSSTTALDASSAHKPNNLSEAKQYIKTNVSGRSDEVVAFTTTIRPEVNFLVTKVACLEW